VRSLVVIPALNEARSIASVVSSVRAEGFDLVVVDDGSTDGTGQVVRAAGAPVLTLATNLGVGGALRCGFRFAIQNGYEAVIQCDADGQHNPGDLTRLVEAAEQSDADLVIGSRFATSVPSMHVSRTRRLAMRLMARVASRVSGTHLTDTTSGFRLFRGPLLESFARNFPEYYLGDTFEATYVAGKAGYAIREIPVSMNPRANGSSSASRLSSIAMIAKVLTVSVLGLHFRVPRKKR